MHLILGSKGHSGVTYAGNSTLQVKVKVWVLVKVLLTRLELQRFTISEVAAD